MRTITVKDLARDAKEFLRFKRSMGITYQRGEHVLDSFLRFVVQRWGNGKIELDDRGEAMVRAARWMQGRDCGQ